MINYFPPINHDELIYSILGRYHKTDGNNNIKDTFQDFFSRSTITPIVDLPCHLDELSSNLPKDMGYSSEFFIHNCTLFPFYSPFMCHESRRKCINIMKSGNGSTLKTKMGIVAGGICKKNHIYYCPKCVEHEEGNQIEPYIHRLHQVEGVFICDKHDCKLKEYGQGILSKIQVTYIDVNKVNYEVEYMDDKNTQDKLLKITNEVKYLLENDVSSYLNNVKIHERYYDLLDEKGYLTASKCVKQDKLGRDFINYYGSDFLDILESQINIKDENNWLKIILRKTHRIVHPIRHILLIDFLSGSIKSFIYYNPEPQVYPCLNKFCNSFKNSSSTEYKITSDYKTREPVATVTCKDCGFIYSRKKSSDIYRIGTIKDFGFLWLGKLEEILAYNKESSLRSISREMECDPKTIVKYANKLGYSNSIQSTMKIYTKRIKNTQENKGLRYKNSILELIRANPTISITEIKQLKYKDYMWLYKNDKVWLMAVSPTHKKPDSNVHNKVDWDKRDRELVESLQTAYLSVKNNEPEIRITKTLLGRKCKVLPYIEKKLNKLPLSKEYLEIIQESVEEFQIRRVNTICDDLRNKGEEIVEWKIKKLAGLKDNLSSKVLEVIKNYLKS